MATAVLRPRDLNAKISFVPDSALCASRSVHRSKPACGRKQNSSPNSRRHRRSPSHEKCKGRERTEKARKAVKESTEANKLVMGKVRILKRGDNLSEGESKIDCSRSLRFEKEDDVVVCSTDGVPNQVTFREKEAVVEDRFAGFVFASPPPSSLPMPMKDFWRKRETFDAVSMAVDLRRILRLDLL